MGYARTQIYLDPRDHRALLNEAHDRGVSLAELIRRIVHEHLQGQSSPRPSRAEAYAALIGLGASGQREISEQHDDFIGQAVQREHTG